MRKSRKGRIFNKTRGDSLRGKIWGRGARGGVGREGKEEKKKGDARERENTSRLLFRRGAGYVRRPKRIGERREVRGRWITREQSPRVIHTSQMLLIFHKEG